MIQTEVVTVTPSMAADFLNSNGANRPLSRNTVQTYAGAMKRGEWHLNGEPIVFDSNGGLLNGQHRCKAIVQAKVPIQTVVVRGVSPESFKTFDSGKKRSAADVLGINGHKYPHYLTTAARAIMKMEAGAEPLNKAFHTSTLVLDTVERHPMLGNWTARFCSSNIRNFCSSVAIGVFTLLEERHGAAKASEFFHEVALGAGLAEDNPAFLLRDRFINQKSGKMRLTTDHQLALIIKAANAHVAGQKVRLLRWGGKDVFPELA